MRYFNNDLLKNRYSSYDVTNVEEMVATLLLTFIDYYLLISLLQNIRKILEKYYYDPLFNPGKLLCINSIFTFSVIVRLISLIYSLIGCGLSHFYDFKHYIDEQKQNFVYFNPFAYESLQIIFICFENVAMLIAAYYWIQATKENDSDDTYCKNQPLYLLILGKILKYAWLFLIIQLLVSLIICNKGIEDQLTSYFVLSCSISSNLLFSFSCYIFITHLEQLYKVEKQFNRKIKRIGITLIASQMFRILFNISYITYECQIKRLKTGKCDNEGNVEFPDQNYYWSFIFIFFTLIADFYPTYSISFLFSPFDKQIEKKSVQDSDFSSESFLQRNN